MSVPVPKTTVMTDRPWIDSDRIDSWSVVDLQARFENEPQQMAVKFFVKNLTTHAITLVSSDSAGHLGNDVSARASLAPTWNFHKYLISRDGKLVADWETAVYPGDDPNNPFDSFDSNQIVIAIKAELAKPAP